MEETAEALDDMMDQVLKTFSTYRADRGASFFECHNIVPQPVSLNVFDDRGDYIGRGIPFLFIKNFTPAQ